MNQRVLRALLASLAAVGFCFVAYIAWIILFFQLRFEPFSAAILYVIVAVGLLFVFSSRLTVLMKTGFTAVGLLAVSGFEYRRSDWSLYVLSSSFVKAAIATGALFLAWRLFRYLVLYYRSLFTGS